MIRFGHFKEQQNRSDPQKFRIQTRRENISYPWPKAHYLILVISVIFYGIMVIYVKLKDQGPFFISDKTSYKISKSFSSGEIII